MKIHLKDAKTGVVSTIEFEGRVLIEIDKILELPGNQLARGSTIDGFEISTKLVKKYLVLITDFLSWVSANGLECLCWEYRRPNLSELTLK